MALIIHFIHTADTAPIYKRIGEKDFHARLPHPTVVATISANGAELELIQSAFKNLPAVTNPKPGSTVRWRGDFKDFILSNWETIRFPEITITEPI